MAKNNLSNIVKGTISIEGKNMVLLIRRENQTYEKIEIYPDKIERVNLPTEKEYRIALSKMPENKVYVSNQQ